MRKSTYKRIFCGMLAALMVVSNSNVTTYAAQEDSASLQTQETEVTSQESAESQDAASNAGGSDAASSAASENTGNENASTSSGQDTSTDGSSQDASTDGSSQDTSADGSQDASTDGSESTDTSSTESSSKDKSAEELSEEEKKAAEEKEALEKAKQEKLEKEKAEQEKLEKEKLEKEKLEKEKAEKEAQESEPINLSTAEESSVSMSISDFWMEDVGGAKHSAATGSTEQDGQSAEVFDFSQIDADLSGKGGFDLSFTCGRSAQDREVKASDYIEFTLPSCFADISASAEDSYYDCSVDGQKVTVTLREIPEEGDLSGRIHLTYTISESIQTGEETTCLFSVQNGTGTRAYKVIFADTEAEVIDEEIKKFSIQGSVVFDETLNGESWTGLVRQAVFDESMIQIVQIYTDGEGVTQEINITPQNGSSKEYFYLHMVHDGNGGGTFRVSNVPEKVKGSDGNTYEVTEYKVILNPKLPYYQYDDSSSLISIKKEDFKDKTTVEGTVLLSLKSQTITLDPTIVPADGTNTTAFPMTAVFSNAALEGKSDIKKNYSPQANAESKTQISVPVGISYKVTQNEVNGYRFDGTYTTSKTGEGGTEGTTQKSSGAAEGKIEEGKDLTITTTNYSQNQSVKFNVEWQDNNSANRPGLTANNFKLQYKVEGSDDWIDLTEEQYSNLQITKAPNFDKSQAALGEYAYTGLPATDKDGKVISYQVVTDRELSNYITSYTDSTGEGETTAKRTFTFLEKENFHASIYWNDASNKENRPDEKIVLQSLKLYRHVGSSYELVENADSLANLTGVKVTKDTSGENWTVDITGLPRYNDNDQEYDYVLVHGSIGEDGSIHHAQVNEQYIAYYDNSSGNYANDTVLCHNNGTITEVLNKKSEEFRATKIWKDPTGNSTTRPTATVTLWRYRTCDAESIDEAFQNGKASQVVFKSSTDGTTEKIASYALDNSGNQAAIKFTSDTLASMSEDYQLPSYDDQGHEYVYFVRETLSGTNADGYEIQYTDSDGQTCKYGAPTKGKITNVRRQKEKVHVTKVWKNPSGTGSIDGVTVQVEIKASADQGANYDILPVLSDAQNSYDELSENDEKTAQTITGFTSAVSHGEVSYYVNTYDSEGRAYDMKTAKLVETVTGADGTTWTVTTDSAGNTTIEDSEGNKYAVTTTYEGAVSQGDGTNEYRYTQTNAITAKREYTLTKQWADSIEEDDLAQIQSINFKLERRSTKDADSEYETVSPAEGESWKISVGNTNAEKDADEQETEQQSTFEKGKDYSLKITKLPKYDAEGYEYYYRATEVSFVTTDGQTITKNNTPADKWSSTYYRSTEGTKVVNYVSKGGGRGFVTISKIWQDDGDEEKHGNVTVRVYLRDQLKEALKSANTEGETTYTDDSVVDLDGLKYNGTNLKYKEIKLNNSAKYTSYLNYAAIDEEILSAEKAAESDRGMKDYIILEVGTGSSDSETVTPSYTYGQLYKAAGGSDDYQITGSVENNDRKYSAVVTADESEGLALLTNTRTGEASIDVTKIWKDDTNVNGDRPDTVQFRLYLNGSVYANIPDTVKVQAKQTDSSSSEDEDSSETSQVDSCRVEIDRESGIITVKSASVDTDNKAEKWLFTITGLPMFNAAGEANSYTIDEVLGDDNAIQGSNSTTYTNKKTVSSIEDTGKNRTYKVEFANTANGTISHFAYKYWKDAGTGANNRPDLRIEVYRYLKDEQTENPDTAVEELQSYEKYADHKDPVWTEYSDTDSSMTEPERNYNWKVTVEDLPQYDENGDAYVYVFKETMANNGETVLGTYESKAETKTLEEGGTYEVFTNTITGAMNIRGKKIWKGLNGYTAEDLPDPLITLYRTTDIEVASKDLQIMTESEISKVINEGKLTKIDTTHLTGSTEGSNDRTIYNFPDTSDESEESLAEAVAAGYLCKVEISGVDAPFYKLPKFDEEGNRYTYLVRESFEGSDDRSNAIAGQLYISTNDNGTITNEFKSNINLRSITVTKKWNRSALENLDEAIKSGENKFPSVTYTLYRYEIGNEDATRTQIAHHTITAAEFAEKYVSNSNAEVSYTFENLRIFSPAGKQYGYYITEIAINGYTITYQDETVVSETDEGEKVESKIAGDEEVEADNTADEELKNNNRCDVTSLPENWNRENAQINTQVSTTNSYSDPGTVTISGTKQWNDYANLEGLRPESITVTLTRRTNSESGQNNQVTNTVVNLTTKDAEDAIVTTPYIVWDYGTNRDTAATWSYKIYNLPRYAANGQPYIYTLSEELVKGYKKANDVSVNTNSSISPFMAAMTNQFEGSYYVRKDWSDGYNKYNLRPTEITVKLQRSTDGVTNWSDIAVNDNQIGKYNETTGIWSGGLPSVSTDSEGRKIVSVKLTAKNVIANTKNAAWGYQFTNLPTEDKDGNKYTYRCIETAIGGVPTTAVEAGGSDLLHCEAGAYECTTEVSVDGTRTTLTNTLSDTSLVVTKKWKGDSEDLYQSRPEKLTFILQKKTYRADGAAATSSEGDSADTDGTWENVTDVDGKVYTFTISKSDNWTKTLEDLPTAEVKTNTDGGSTIKYTSYSLYYRAVEVHTGATYDANGNLLTNGTGDPLTPEGAQNYKDITAYSGEGAEGEGKAHYYNDQLLRNESTITNKLIKDDPVKSVSATKKWINTTGSSATIATFELLYKTASETNWHCYGGKSIPSDENWSSHKSSETGESCKLKKVSSTAEGDKLTVTWNDLPKYDASGNELEYKIVEHTVTGYVTEQGNDITDKDTGNTSTTFTNIESQSYTVKKIWQNANEAEKAANGYFTATFKLQRKVDRQDTAGADGDGWTDVTTAQVAGYKDIVLDTKYANKTLTGKWSNLPKYTSEKKKITYRAVETLINGKEVKCITDANDTSVNTNGAYMVSYQYGTGAATDQVGKSAEFGDTQTTVTNRMIYGFVNLSKKAAYLAPSITSSGESSLSGATFKILKKNSNGNFVDYVTGVTTDKNGNLQNTNGKYGKEQKYLVAGTYKLQETQAPSGFTVWKNGVTFKVGTGETTLLSSIAGGSTLKDTGEHGTAWISTTQLGSFVLKLKAAYVAADSSTAVHSIEDSCKAQSGDGDALDLESRGVVTFTKTGEKKQDNTYETLEYNKNEAGKGNTAYFGIYTDQACTDTSQVAGMKSKDPTGTDAAKMILTNLKQDGTTELNKNNNNGLPYLRAFGTSEGTASTIAGGDAAVNDAAGIADSVNSADYTDYPFTLLSGTYYIKELTAPAGYRLDTTVRKLVVGNISSVDITEETEEGEGTNLSDLYVNNKAQIMDVNAGAGSTDYSWSNTPNQVTLTKTDADSQEALSGVVYTFARTDVPKDESDQNLTDYFLKDSMEVTTGKSYKAARSTTGNWSLTEITGADANVKTGQICIKGLPEGKYKLTEKTELSGYILDGSSASGSQSGSQTVNKHEFHFEITGGETGVDTDVQKLTFADTNTKNSVTFCKVNTIDTEAGVTTTKGLAGAEFVVCEDDGSGNYKKKADGTPEAVQFYAAANKKATEKVSKVTTGTDGKVTIYGLPTANTSAAVTSADATKTYHLVETKAPKGYKLQTSSVVFTIDRQGNVQVKNADSSFETVSDKTVTMNDEPIKLYIRKFGESESVAGVNTKFTLKDTCRTGVDTTGVTGCDHKLADGEKTKDLTIIASDGKLMLPIESIIAGHTYTLTEKTTAAGYQADAVVVFHVAADGTKIDSIVSTTGGYLVGDNKCAALDEANTTIKIYDKRVGITLTKKDKDTNKVLTGAQFTLKPYGSNTGSESSSAFGTGYSQSEVGSTDQYDSTTNTWTFTTNDQGQFTIPGGLLVHSSKYLLQETKAVNNYYLSKELEAGVILSVDDTGKVTMSRQGTYSEAGAGDCPITLTGENAKNTTSLTAVNTQSSSFTLTKKVEGNMGDQNGTFEIKLSVYEPGDVQNETTLIATKTVKLKANETYDSVTGLITQAGSSSGSVGSSGSDSASSNALAFGKDAIPKEATLIIEETGDYAATVKILKTAGGEATQTIDPVENEKGKFKLTLENAGQIFIELTNTKDAAIDVGVVNEKQAPLAAAALLIPAAWLFYRYRRRRRKY